MLPKEIVEILQKYQNEIAEEISNINKHISYILEDLTSVNSVISNNMLTLMKNITNNSPCEENDLLNDSQTLRKYISEMSGSTIRLSYNNEETFHFNKEVKLFVVPDIFCPFCNIELNQHKVIYDRIENNKTIHDSFSSYICPSCGKLFILDEEADKFNIDNTNVKFIDNYYNKITFHDVIVLQNVNKCVSNQHDSKEVTCNIPIILDDGSIIFKSASLFYCYTCNKIIMLKSIYDELGGIPACIIEDNTQINETENRNSSWFSDKTNSILRQYGYNVNCNDKLTREQRRTILSMQLLSENLNKTSIISYFDTNIHNGELRENSKKNWDSAVSKWKEDKKYVNDFNMEIEYEKININKLILKYQTKGKQSL